MFDNLIFKKHEDLLNALKEDKEKDMATITRLRKEIEEMKKETYKDELVESMREQIIEANKSMEHGFPINSRDYKKMRDWERKHIEEKHPGALKNPGYFGAIGGNFHYEFIPTSIGTIGTVKCTCGEEFTFQEI